MSLSYYVHINVIYVNVHHQSLWEETTTAMGNPVCIHLWYHCCVFCTALMRPETVLSAVVHSLVPHDSNVTVCNSKSRGLPVYSVHVRTILLSKCLPCPYVLSVSSVYIYTTF